MTAQEFNATYLPLGEALYRLAYHILDSGQDAQDAVQDLYARLWKARDSLEGVKNPKAYCLTLMRNACIDRIRSSGKTGTVRLTEAFSEISDSDNRMNDKERLWRVMKAIEELPQGQRTVLKKRVLEEKTYGEISQEIGINQLTLRVLLSQARKRLRQLYETD